MGEDLNALQDAESVRRFSHALVRDVRSLERMLQHHQIETGVRRIGCEQEYFLVDAGGRPAPLALELLELLGDPFTTELALFNLEANLEPVFLAGNGLLRMEEEMDRLLGKVREAAATLGGGVILTGILPTLARSHLTLDNITPRPRYLALNDAVTRARGGKSQQLRIEGADELVVESDSVMLEACNTSCQVHLQLSPEEFPSFYNAAQAVLAPVLAAAANAPLLFGRRLWAETRIALFQQSVDTRRPDLHAREMPPRVRFGDGWVVESVLELFQEDITRFRVLLAGPVEEDSAAVLDQGGIPRLRALQFFNGTVYRWNRPCYGITDGKPHLRIECRALPAGPSVADEMANAAFWIGAVLGVVGELGDIGRRMEFGHARQNFLAASRGGLHASLRWPGRGALPAPTLILEELLPLARKGLESAGVDAAVVERSLGIIEARVRAERTGASWLTDSLEAMTTGSADERLAAITAATARMQKEGRPIHEWPLAAAPGVGDWVGSYRRVEQYMSTRLVTVGEDEQAEMVAWLMNRKGIRHVLVEDAEHQLTGVVSYRSLLRFLAGEEGTKPAECAIGHLIDRDPITVSPETSTLEAIRLIREHEVACLPVVSGGRLVGIVSERDFLPIAFRVLEDALAESPGRPLPGTTDEGANEEAEEGFVLHPRLAADSLPVCDLPLCSVRLMDEARYPWLILIPRRPGIAEMLDLSTRDQERLWEETRLCARVLREREEPDRINIGALGNVVPQLHMHVVARREGDEAWPGPVWGAHPPRRYPEEIAEGRVDGLRKSLRRPGSPGARDTSET